MRAGQEDFHATNPTTIEQAIGSNFRVFSRPPRQLNSAAKMRACCGSRSAPLQLLDDDSLALAIRYDYGTRERSASRPSARQLSMIAIGGAIGTGLFLGSGFAIGFAGPAVLVSYSIGALITLLLMGCLAEMTVAHPTSGSFGAWAEFYIGPLAGFMVRYAYWAGIVFALGTEVTAIAVYMRYWFPMVPGWIWIAGFSSILIIVNAFNVKVFGAVEYAFSSAEDNGDHSVPHSSADGCFVAGTTAPSVSPTTPPTGDSFPRAHGECGSAVVVSHLQLL